MKRYFSLIFTLFFIFSLQSYAISQQVVADIESPILDSKLLKHILPDKSHTTVDREIVQILSKSHYNSITIDDYLSKKLLDNYILALDEQKIYFLAKDIRQFSIYEDKLDEALEQGDLKPAFEIFNIYQKRTVERLSFLIKLINKNQIKNLNFDTDEFIEIDRENASWATDSKQLDQLWRKRLKNTVLSLKLAGKSLDEIETTLKKRYTSQLNKTTQINSEDIFRTYINAFSQIYDPHTQYFSPRVSENFNIMMSLSLEGIGAMLQSKNEYTRIARLVAAGPAEKSKALKPGDRIVGVAQGVTGEIIDVVGWRLDDVVDLIRGPKGTIVRLEIIPVDETNVHKTKIVQITRNTVKLEEQACSKKIINVDEKYKIGIIEIPTFYTDFEAHQNGDRNYKSTTRDVRRLLNELISQNVNGIIIDLRDNGGGSLQEVNELTGLFIQKGPIVQIRYYNGQVSQLMDPDPDVVYTGPLLVMVNRMSASASEIFAGAIQDYNRGIIVGTRTFGKGTVQSLTDLTKGRLKLTRAKFYRISGQSTQNRGVIPDISYPAIYDPDKIGESSLPGAMPWDTIIPVPHYQFQSLDTYIPTLKAKHEKRIKKDPDFVHLLSELHLSQETLKKTKFSLNEKKRKAYLDMVQQKKLDNQNKMLVAKGLEPIDKIDIFSDMEEDYETEKDNDNKDDDPLLKESEQIMADFIVMLNNR